MKKFLARLALLAVIMLLVIVVMHVAAVWRIQDELEAVYTVSPSAEVLCLGSSQVGCAIAEDPTGRIRKLWVSDTIAPSCLMRLKELERRGQLDHLKAVVVPFNLHSVMAQSERGYLWAWYLELPVSWRYLDMLPYGRLDLAWYMLRNLRFPFRMILSEVPPDRDALANRPETYRRKMLAQFRQAAREAHACGSCPDWERRLFDAYREMDEICKRHGIRFVAFKAPLLPDFERNIPEEELARMSAYEQRLRDMGIEYVMPQVSLDERHFFDDAHLVRSGAEIFTAELLQNARIVVK
ncbi:MAG: hypothetical protein J6V72_17935 [Kiritimatiellae bacterium]|nr:hypothetical protein [Kiritimatiellia bacterium]